MLNCIEFSTKTVFSITFVNIYFLLFQKYLSFSRQDKNVASHEND